MRNIEALVDRLPLAHREPQWQLEETMENLAQLNQTRIRPIPVLMRHPVRHVHDFPTRETIPSKLKPAVLEAIDNPSENPNIQFASGLNNDATGIGKRYKKYYAHNGMNGKVYVNLPPPEEAQALIAITLQNPGQKIWPAKMLVEMFPQIDFKVTMQLIHARRRNYQIVAINTTRREDDTYQVEVLPREGNLRLALSNLSEAERKETTFFLSRQEQRLVIDLLAARV